MEQSETSTRELTLEEAVSIAILLQKNEQLAETAEVYRRIFDIAPNGPLCAAHLQTCLLRHAAWRNVRLMRQRPVRACRPSLSASTA
jgi:hypothetical protein